MKMNSDTSLMNRVQLWFFAFHIVVGATWKFV